MRTALCVIYEDGHGYETVAVFEERVRAEWELANNVSGNGWYHLPFIPVHPDWDKTYNYAYDEPVGIAGYYAGRRVVRAKIKDHFD